MLVNTKHVYVHNMGWETYMLFSSEGAKLEYNTNLKLGGRLQSQHNQGGKWKESVQHSRKCQQCTVSSCFEYMLLLEVKTAAQPNNVQETEIQT
jgi:hypothetical protein